MTAAPASFPPGRWRASWIWATPSSAAEPVAGAGRRVTAAFRRSFEVGSVPASAPARLAAVGRAIWWVNGIEVGQGPVRANPRRQVWDDADIAGLLRPGGNEVAVLVTVDGDPTAWSMSWPASNDLAGGALAFEADLGGDGWLVTDPAWQATVLAGWGARRPRGLVLRGAEMLDARSLPEAWATGAVDWPAAVVRRAQVFGGSGRAVPPSFPGGPLRGRPISRPRALDVGLAPVGDGVFVADRVRVGTLVLDVEGPAGATVALRAHERVDAGGRPVTAPEDTPATVTLDGTRRRIETVDRYGLHALTVEPSGADGVVQGVTVHGVTVHGVTVRERLHPVTGGHVFRCSDPLLGRIAEVARRTVTICSLDAYVDCPTREQRAWTGDSVVHQMVDLTTNDDWTLARWHPVLAASPRADGMLPMAVAGDAEATDLSIIPDWALHWVHAVWNLYRYVGDRQEVAALLPAAEGVLRWFVPFLDAEGVPVDVPGWVIIDWSAVHSDGVSAALAGLWGRALLEFAEMAEWLDDRGRAAWARGCHDRLRAGFERLWDPERGRYADTIVAGWRLPMASQHGQAAAIVGGLVPPGRHGRLVEVMTDATRLVHAAFSRPDGPCEPGSETELGGAYLMRGHPEPWWDVDRLVVRAQPFFRYVVHDALAAAGRADLIPALLRDWAWLLQRCPTSLSEVWYGGTTSHGWSATPARDLVQRVLGVTPETPGFGTARVQPELGDLSWAEGTVPTPAGPLSVRMDATTLVIDSPVPVVAVLGSVTTRHPTGRTTLTR